MQLIQREQIKKKTPNSFTAHHMNSNHGVEICFTIRHRFSITYFLTIIIEVKCKQYNANPIASLKFHKKLFISLLYKQQVR